MSYYNLPKEDIESLKNHILVDIQILKDYDNEETKNKIKSILTIDGGNKKLEFDNNNRNKYNEYWLTQICNAIYAYKNTIYEIEYEGKKYIINSGSNFNNYEKYTGIKDANYLRLREYYWFVKKNYLHFDIIKSLSDIISKYCELLDIELLEDIDSFNQLKKYTKPIANYFPIGFNKSGERIEVVDKLDFVKYNSKFIEHWKPISRKIIYDQILKIKDPNTEILPSTLEMKGGFLINNSKADLLLKQHTTLYNDISDRQKTKNIRELKNAKRSSQKIKKINELNYKNQRKSVKLIKTKEKSKIEETGKLLLKDIDDYRMMWDNLLNGENTRDIFR